MLDRAERIAVLCREMERGDLRPMAAEMGAEPLLDRILDALTAAEVDADALDRDLDELDARLVDHGIPGGLVPPTWRLYEPTPTAAHAAHPAIEVWACPTGRCTRWLPTDDGGPTCGVQGRPLVKTRLGR